MKKGIAAASLCLALAAGCSRGGETLPPIPTEATTSAPTPTSEFTIVAPSPTMDKEPSATAKALTEGEMRRKFGAAQRQLEPVNAAKLK